MSEPEIWTIKMADHPQDDFVRLSAYKALDLQRAELIAENASLKAEVERLHKYVETMERESMSDEYDINHQTRIINGLLTDKERLQAEVERLRKAGDALAREICILGPVDDKEKKAIADWNAAKEGKQP